MSRLKTSDSHLRGDCHFYSGCVLLLSFIFIVFLPNIVIIVSHHIDGNRYRQDENVILAGVDLYAIGIRQAEPFL